MTLKALALISSVLTPADEPPMQYFCGPVPAFYATARQRKLIPYHEEVGPKGELRQAWKMNGQYMLSMRKPDESFMCGVMLDDAPYPEQTGL